MSFRLYENFRYLLRLLNTHKHDLVYDGKHGPVVGIHGIFGSWASHGVKRYLRENGVKAYLPYLGYFLNDFDHYVPQIANAINAYPKATLLGFSAGGIALLRYAEKYGWDNFHKIITVGTPFLGISEAPFLKPLGGVFDDLMPNSPLLRSIFKLRPPQSKVVSVFGEIDEFTPNPQTLKLNWPIVIVGAKNHGDLQDHEKWLKDFLDNELGIKRRSI